MWRLCFIAAGLPFFTYLVKAEVLYPTFVWILLAYTLLTVLSMLVIKQEGELFSNRILFLIQGFWVALIHFCFINGYFSSGAIRFLIATFLGVLGVIGIFAIMQRK